MVPPRGNLFNLAIAVAAVLLAVTALLVAQLTVESMRGREQAALLQRADGLAELTRRVVEAYVSHGIDLLETLEDTQEAVSEEAFQARLTTIAESDQMVTNLGVLNAEGVMIASSFGGLGESFVDRRYFRELLQGRATVLGDLVIGRVTDRWILPVAIARRDAEGGFAGVLVLGLAVDKLLEAFDVVIAERLDLVALVHPDGRVALHAARPSPRLRSVFDPTPSLPMEAGAPSALPGYRLLTRPLARTDLSLVLGIDLERAFATLGAQRQATYATGGGFALLFLLLGFGLILHLRRLQRAQRRLQEMMAEATAASEAKTRFIASMNHELRTPLNAIIGFSEMLALPAFAGQPEKVREYATLISSSGQHLLGIVDHVLELSRFERYGYRPKLERVAVEALVRESVRLFSEATARRGLKVVLRPDAEAVIARLDPTACRQILLNLLDNAAKHVPDATRIELAWRRCVDRLVLEVRDEGPGFAAADLRRLGEPFYRGADAEASRSEGLGIGLSIVRFLAAAHGGDVTFANHPQGGALVTVVLPLDGGSPERADEPPADPA